MFFNLNQYRQTNYFLDNLVNKCNLNSCSCTIISKTCQKCLNFIRSWQIKKKHKPSLNMRKSETFIFFAEISLKPISDEDNTSFNEVHRQNETLVEENISFNEVCQQNETLKIEEQHEIISENDLNSIIINQMDRPVEENISFNEDYQQMERPTIEDNTSLNEVCQQNETLKIDEIINENDLNSIKINQQLESELNLEASKLFFYKLFFCLFHLVFNLKFLKIKILFFLSILFLCARLYYFFDSKYIEFIFFKSFELKSIDLTIRSM
jgi:hypothetical protein